MDTPNGNPKANLKITETQPAPVKPTLLTEELPGGGLTQEEFKHTGRNLAPNEEEDDSEKE